MPVLFRCSGCGTVIYRFERVGQDCFGLPTPSELLTMFNGRCPTCGRELRLPSIEDIVISGRTRSMFLKQVSHRKADASEPLLQPNDIHGGTLRIVSVSQ